jgi:hypothetical protein
MGTLCHFQNGNTLEDPSIESKVMPISILWQNGDFLQCFAAAVWLWQG